MAPVLVLYNEWTVRISHLTSYCFIVNFLITFAILILNIIIQDCCNTRAIDCILSYSDLK